MKKTFLCLLVSLVSIAELFAYTSNTIEPPKHIIFFDDYAEFNSTWMSNDNSILKNKDPKNPKTIISYTNPVTSILKVKRNQNNIKKISIFNKQGIKLETYSFEEKEIEIDLSKYKAGIYLIQLDLDDSNTYQVFKIIKK